MFIASGSISNNECHPSSPVPAVSFDRDNLVVATSEDYFTIVRNGSTMFPTTVYLSVLLKPQDTALEGVDFELTSKVNTMGGATLSLSVTILNNSTVPGNKVFHVQIASVDNGHVVEPSVLTITVLDMNTRKLQQTMHKYFISLIA